MRTVVIGAGVAGLTAAGLLARAGYDVTVLEAHVDPGGCAATYFHRGYRFDVGATLTGGFQPGGAHAVVGERLGIEWPVRRVEPAMVVHTPDAPGGQIVRWGDAERWREERRRVFGAAAEPFWRSQEAVADQVWRFAAALPPWPPGSGADLARLAGVALRQPRLAALAPLLPATMAQWAGALGASAASPAFWTFLDAQLLISAQAQAEGAAALFGAVALDLPRAGVYHVRGGVGALAETLSAAVTRHGGQVLYKTEVTRIETVGGRVARVHARRRGRSPRHRSGFRESSRLRESDECVFETDLVIANITPWDIVRLLGDEAPQPLRRQAPALRPQWGAFTLYLGVESSVVPRGAPDHHQVVQAPGLPLGEGNSIFLSLSPEWDETRAPPGQRVVTVSTHTRIAPWWRLRQAGDGGAAYEARVAVYAETLLRAAERVFPGLRRASRLCLRGTPVTFKRFTGRNEGFVGGFPQTSLFSGLNPRLPLEGLWMVGDSIFPGQSTAAVTLGAMRVVDMILTQRQRTTRMIRVPVV